MGGSEAVGGVATRTTCARARAPEQGLDRPRRHNVARVYCQGEDGGPAKVKSRACARACVCTRVCVCAGKRIRHTRVATRFPHACSVG